MPEAGWYEDPRDARHVRWWDGEAWTARTALAPGARFDDDYYRDDDGDDGAPRRSRVATVVTVAAVAIAAGFATFLGARAVLDGDLADVDSPATGPSGGAPTGDGGQADATSTSGSAPTRATVPTAELVVGPTEAGFVAVLASIAQADVDAEAAAERARTLTALDARVLDSDRFTTDSRPEPLTPDLWIVWSGPFPDDTAAQAFCDTEAVAAGLTSCYPLRLVPGP